MNIQERFGHLVRVIRESKGMSIEDLADVAELHYTYVSDIERGKRNVTLKTIEALAKGLDVQPVRLLADKDEKFLEVTCLLETMNKEGVDLVKEIIKSISQKEIFKIKSDL